jgi:uncharacterized membrane protein
MPFNGWREHTMIFTSGNTLANFLALLSLISAFVIGWFNNGYLWLIVTAVFVAGAYWTKKYKSSGDTTAKPIEFVVALVICAVLFVIGQFASGKMAG